MRQPSPYYHPLLPVPVSGVERLAAAASHASLVLAVPFLLPLAVYFLFPLVQPGSDYVRHQAIQALLFHLLITVATGVIFGMAWFFTLLLIIGWPVAALLYVLGGAVLLWGWAISLIATIRAIQGLPYRMPLVGGFGS